jgi:ketosteroid isomerase-like protein
MSQENVEIVRGQLEAFNRGDFSAAIEALDEDVEWQVPHVATLDAPASGLLRGRREMIENFGQWLEAWDSFAFEATEIRAGRGSDVFLAGIQTGRGRTSGLDVTVPTFHVLTIREGKIARMRTFRERADALEAAGLSERAARADS